ncbi:MAG: hypothetical protein WBD51_04415 [Burkholderiaceae bacterium]
MKFPSRLSTRRKYLYLSPVTILIAFQAACGGSGTPLDGPLTGVVIDVPIQGATVCLDLNRNVLCDADEPSSSATSADGRFQIDGLTTEQRDADAPLLAIVPATAIDADNPGVPIGIPYWMSAPGPQAAPGSQIVISPLSTMVQAGVRDGLSIQDASVSVGAQAGVDPARILANYALTPADTVSQLLARFASGTIVPVLQSGQPIVVEPPQMNLGPGYTVTRFRFSDNANYTIGVISTDGVFSDGINQYQPAFYDVRNGVAQSTAGFYSGDVFLADDNTWTSCDASQAGTVSGGNPRRLRICGSSFIQYSRVQDLSGTNMEDAVLDLIQTNGTEAWDFNTAPLSSALFPPGSQRLVRDSQRLVDNGRYNPVNGAVPGVASLAALVAAYQIPVATVVGSNLLSLGSEFDAQGNRTTRLRVAFGPSGNSVRYYACNEALSSCLEDGAGNYLTGFLGGAPVMVFTGVSPEIESERLFVEREGQVWFGEIARPAYLRELSRLNDIAFRALAEQLGAVMPAALR